MRPLLLNATDVRGGAGRAAYRLHRGLRDIGVDSRMLVQTKESDHAHVLGPRNRFETLMGIVRPQLDLLPLYYYPRRQDVVFYPGWLPDRLGHRVAAAGADVVHLHWMSRGFMRVASLRRLVGPIVWTLHDMWAFTGGCHYDAGCGRYMQACGACPALGSDRERDLSSRGWAAKRSSWGPLAFQVVAPSRWLADCARRSPILGHCAVAVIPNGIDLSVYRPMPREFAREVLALPKGRRLVLVDTPAGSEARRKGVQHLEGALHRLAQGPHRDLYTLVVIGASPPDAPRDFGIQTLYLGRLYDDVSLALAYCAADVFVAPSVQDNLPNTVMEALACGVPCVAFDIGGMPDMIEHHANGYLAQPASPEDLARGIEWVVADQQRREMLSARARAKAQAEFDVSRVARRYLEVYQEAMAAAQTT